jgi:hypothetical protein
MTYKLSWNPSAHKASQEFRNSDPPLSKAFDRVLDELRATGTARGSVWVGDDFSAHMTPVSAPQREECVVVWYRDTDDRPHIVYLGPLDGV